MATLELRLFSTEGGERQIETSNYDHLDHGYAVTVHKAQAAPWTGPTW